jgi:hypothetical protein
MARLKKPASKSRRGSSRQAVDDAEEVEVFELGVQDEEVSRVTLSDNAAQPDCQSMIASTFTGVVLLEEAMNYQYPHYV